MSRKDCGKNGLHPIIVSGYRFVWVITLFDLPVDTRQGRKEYAPFRKFLLKDGFLRMQFSVYMATARATKTPTCISNAYHSAFRPTARCALL